MRKYNSTNNENRRSITAGCPITSTFEMIGGRWKIIIIWNLKAGPMRYHELKKGMPKVTEKMLIQQLKALVSDGWVSKKDYGEIPPRTAYSLTDFGASFLPILHQIYDWGLQHKVVEKTMNQP